jgi:hypothetical protein
LKLIPDEHASRDRHAAGKTHTKALLVDPRKSMAMQTASLTWHPVRGYTDRGLLSNTLDRIPLSKWNLPLDNGGPASAVTVPSERKESKVTGDLALTASEYPALRFVSYQEAEKNYKALFPGAGWVAFIYALLLADLLLIGVRNRLSMKPHTLENIASSSAALESANHKLDTHDWFLSYLHFKNVNYIDDVLKCAVQVSQGGPLRP